MKYYSDKTHFEWWNKILKLKTPPPQHKTKQTENQIMRVISHDQVRTKYNLIEVVTIAKYLREETMHSHSQILKFILTLFWLFHCRYPDETHPMLNKRADA